jgi:hypothetical protein
MVNSRKLFKHAGDCLMTSFGKLGAYLEWCTQHGAPQHYALSIHDWPHGHFTPMTFVSLLPSMCNFG